jgi:putative exporter of polyketide antibiotics
MTLCVSILLTVADQAYAAATGELLTVAGMRAVWLSAPLMLVGVALLVYGLVPRGD